MGALAGYVNLLDIAKINGSDELVGLVDETTRLNPEVRLGAARTIAGTSYKILVRTALPAVSFRAANQGTYVTKDTYAERLVSTFITNPAVHIDVAVAERDEMGPARVLAFAASGLMEATMQMMGRQFYYGANFFSFASGDTSGEIGTTGVYGGVVNGPPGLIDMFDTTYEVDATGTTANTASDVWGVTFGDQNVTWVYGKNGMLRLSDPYMFPIQDPNNAGAYFTVYRQELNCYPGLQLGDMRSVVRIKNVTTDSGKGLTDNLLSQAESLLPAGIRPQMWLMSRRSLNQLRQSRTATNSTGAPAPYPTEANGIPVLPTDSIPNCMPINWLSK